MPKVDELREMRARAIIGCKLPSDKLFRKERVRTKDHDFPETMEWHPKTGAKLWTTIEVPIEALDVTQWPRILKTGNLTCEVVEAEDGTLIAVANKNHVSLMFSALNKTKAIDLNGFRLQTSKKYLRDRLVPHALWNENYFGLYVVVGA